MNPMHHDRLSIGEKGVGMSGSIKSVVAGLSVCILLAGCSTFSFSPPHISHQKVSTDLASCSNSDGSAIGAGFAGAQQLIENYRIGYRCAREEAANGRQIFQVPALLATVTGLVGPSFGLSADGTLAAGASAGFLSGGQSYYVPEEKAKLFNTAIDAVACVKTESVGVTHFHREAGDGTDRAFLSITDADGEGTIEIDVGDQYFNAVAGALGEIDVELAERLMGLGEQDVDSLMAKLKTLIEEQEKADSDLDDAEAERQKLDDAAVQTISDALTGKSEGLVMPELRAMMNIRNMLVAKVISLEIKAMQKKLQECVLQMKVN